MLRHGRRRRLLLLRLRRGVLLGRRRLRRRRLLLLHQLVPALRPRFFDDTLHFFLVVGEDHAPVCGGFHSVVSESTCNGSGVVFRTPSSFPRREGQQGLQ